MDWATDYCWVVICKNRCFHHKGNTSFEHRIVLAETDSYSPLPMMTEEIKVAPIQKPFPEVIRKMKEVLK